MTPATELTPELFDCLDGTFMIYPEGPDDLVFEATIAADGEVEEASILWPAPLDLEHELVEPVISATPPLNSVAVGDTVELRVSAHHRTEDLVQPELAGRGIGWSGSVLVQPIPED